MVEKLWRRHMEAAGDVALRLNMGVRDTARKRYTDVTGFGGLDADVERLVSELAARQQLSARVGDRLARLQEGIQELVWLLESGIGSDELANARKRIGGIPERGGGGGSRGGRGRAGGGVGGTSSAYVAMGGDGEGSGGGGKEGGGDGRKWHWSCVVLVGVLVVSSLLVVPATVLLLMFVK
ncbi:unnamed protein product [Closterium sp. Naga37s-1]|nr:unnamed protein product [Closterium sp. Naga37s-1]